MKWILTVVLLSASVAQALPVRVEVGTEVFTPQEEVGIRRNLRTRSTPPYTLILQGPDIKSFASFTAAHIGQEMQIFMCNQVVSTPNLSDSITNGRIEIQRAMVNGRLETYAFRGSCLP